VILAAFASRGLANAVFELCLEKHEIIISEYTLPAIPLITPREFWEVSRSRRK
jgi:hypothetical protein